MKLLKFGGTSLANAKKFLSVSDIIEKNIKTNQIAVVLSAPAKVTNYLAEVINQKIHNDKILETVYLTENIFFQIIHDLSEIQDNFPYQNIEKTIKTEFNQLRNTIKEILFLRKCSDSTRAIIISRGEILSVYIMKSILKSKNYHITIIDPVKNFLSIGNDYLDSIINIDESKRRISNIKFNKNTIILMPGFISGNKNKELVVLGRNGSDYSATVLAACLNAKSCEIWTDVDGVFTCDPKEVSNPSLLKSISYQEAMELSYFGAKVLHPRAIEPVAQYNIPCFIKNTANINSIGTLICCNDHSEQQILKGITHLDNIAMLNISGIYIKNISNIISRIFNIISTHNIKILLITQSSSENKISFCFFQNEIDKILFIFNQEFKLESTNELLNPFQIYNSLSILSVIGSNINKKCNIASKIFSTLGSLKINVLAIGQGSSEHSISLVIKQKNVLKAIQNVHNTLFFNKKTIHVFLIGIGGVGSTLLEQILKQKKFLKKQNIEIKIFAIANSKKILFFDDSINLSNWKNNFFKSQNPFNLKILKQLIKNNYYQNAVIVDCTSDQLLSEQYESFLFNDFHIVASNKKANTNNLDYYHKIRIALSKTNKKFLYETNVGAGLPVIETIQNLFKTGDTLIRFQGILSGSLSFIFGRLEEGILLSQATKEAKKLGFTEPNPYDDLSGIDVARKLLILARESGYKIELKDIKIEPLLPNSFKKNEKVDEFLLDLQQLDSYFLKKTNKAKNNGNVLRFIATIEKTGQCFVKIQEVNINNPLYKVKNGENALAFYTNYYQPIPLVFRGYGAGNDVTASGVFSDLLRIL